jgi:prepilin-type N-terminal cleavage/methylation domain-containing protein
MNRAVKAFRYKLADRSGLTLLEVMMALAVFVVGSVGIVALFMTASVLHVEANNRRRASFIASNLLAQTRAMRLRDVFARTQLVNDTGANIDAEAVVADPIHGTASFDLYPIFDTFFPLRPGQDPGRTEGPVLIQGEGGVPPVPREWAWYTSWTDTVPADPTVPDTFGIVGGDRGLWGTATGTHSPGQFILQPRTWLYVLDDPGVAPGDAVVPVRGDPATYPVDPAGTNDGAPMEGYIVIEEEWMPYESRGPAGFTVADLNNDGLPDRGWADTGAVAHAAGTPVTVAREHPYYPGFFYTLQFYPTDATGQEAHVVISVGYGTEQRFRVYTLRSIFAPSRS